MCFLRVLGASWSAARAGAVLQEIQLVYYRDRRKWSLARRRGPLTTVFLSIWQRGSLGHPEPPVCAHQSVASADRELPFVRKALPTETNKNKKEGPRLLIAG